MILPDRATYALSSLHGVLALLSTNCASEAVSVVSTRNVHVRQLLL